MMLIHKNTIKALAQVVTRDDSRYHLNGVKVEKSGTAVATDGHVLLVAPLASAVPGEYPSFPSGLASEVEDVASAVEGVVPIDVLNGAVKTIARRNALDILDHVVVTSSASNNGHLRVTSADGNGVVTDSHVDTNTTGTFPDWTKVIPSGAVTLRVTFRQDVLMSLAKAAKALGHARSGVCFEFRQEPTVVGTDQSSERSDDADYSNSVGIVMTSEHTTDKVTGAVMPMRT